VPHLQRAVEQFQQALKADKPALEEASREDVLVLCGSALRRWAGAVIEAEEELPDEEQSEAVEAAAHATARQLLERAVQVRPACHRGCMPSSSLSAGWRTLLLQVPYNMSAQSYVQLLDSSATTITHG
jgi:hypothetical protein